MLPCTFGGKHAAVLLHRLQCAGEASFSPQAEKQPLRLTHLVISSLTDSPDVQDAAHRGNGQTYVCEVSEGRAYSNLWSVHTRCLAIASQYTSRAEHSTPGRLA